MRHLLRIEDLTDADIDSVLRHGARDVLPRGPTRVVGLVFLEESLRTRVGFASAAARLGWSAVSVDQVRSGPTSIAESWDDTLRTVSGLVDVVVARPGVALSADTVARQSDVPLINGGDRGCLAEHPTQALIDLFAIQQLCGSVEDLTVALVGDLRMRSARSLLALFSRRRPRKVVALTDELLRDERMSYVEQRAPWQLDDVDVLYVIGMPHEALALDRRERLIVDHQAMKALPNHAIVLSPLPVIDEIAAGARNDRRMRMFEQNAWSVAVRACILQRFAAELE